MRRSRISRFELFAACCAMTSSVPSLMVGDDRAQVSTSFSYGAVIGDAPALGWPVFRAPGDSESTLTMTLDGSQLLFDRWQVGFDLPLVRRARGSDSYAGLGDLSATVAYELLPEWDYSAWKPHVFVFAHVLTPTGRPVYDSVSPEGVDSTGRGFFSIGGGALALRSIGWFAFSVAGELHHAIARSFTTSEGELHASPGWGGTAQANAGYGPFGWGRFFVNLGFGPAFEGGVETTGVIASASDLQMVWNASASLVYLAGADVSASLAYADQTLFGPATNTALNRTVSLQLQYRFER